MSSAINEQQELVLTPEQKQIIIESFNQALSVVLSDHSGYVPTANTDRENPVTVARELASEHGDQFLTQILIALPLYLVESISMREYYAFFNNCFAIHRQNLEQSKNESVKSNHQ